MFHSARLRLTAWYLLIIMLVCVLFSGVIYKLLMSEFGRFEKAQRFRFERKLEEEEIISPNMRFKIISPAMPINTELIEETSKRIMIMLISINSGILIISGMLGYVLAGRTLKPIKDMMDEQNRFISDASHEIRTPLTSLKSAFEVFLRTNQPTIKDAKIVVTESIEEVNKLQSLSESLLQLAQYQKPNGHTHFEHLNLDVLIHEAIHNINMLAQHKSIAITYENTGIHINGNKYGLIDLFIILLDNAVKYSSEKSTILLSAKKIDSNIKIVVIDEGIGIEKNALPHIFDRFYRADKARSKKSKGGYGLGLAIAKKIVDLHRGTIEVKNNEVKGATFIVSLPLHKS